MVTVRDVERSGQCARFEVVQGPLSVDPNVHGEARDTVKDREFRCAFIAVMRVAGSVIAPATAESVLRISNSS
ncbi:hypothetical protein NicSoilB8_09710 [Arthrobacter sp. NicSoilB8]|nr:hypothetical protein NicSoilB8_09710 [Arthrobacter sp. NicSoilB8]